MHMSTVQHAKSLAHGLERSGSERVSVVRTSCHAASPISVEHTCTAIAVSLFLSNPAPPHCCRVYDAAATGTRDLCQLPATLPCRMPAGNGDTLRRAAESARTLVLDTGPTAPGVAAPTISTMDTGRPASPHSCCNRTASPAARYPARSKHTHTHMAQIVSSQPTLPMLYVGNNSSSH
jgi:hypothetical protein